MSNKGFPTVGPMSSDRQKIDAINRALSGKLNATGTVSLAKDATSTTLSDQRIGGTSFVGLFPAVAGAETVHPYVSARADGSATLTHTSTSTSTLQYLYLVIG